MTEITWNGIGGGPPDSELVERPRRRRRPSAKHKLRILREADACSTPSELGALLRREGLYVSHLTYWRTQREAGDLEESRQPRWGKPTSASDVEIADLRRRLERAEADLAKARRVIAMLAQTM